MMSYITQIAQDDNGNTHTVHSNQVHKHSRNSQLTYIYIYMENNVHITVPCSNVLGSVSMIFLLLFLAITSYSSLRYSIPVNWHSSLCATAVDLHVTNMNQVVYILRCI